MLQSFRLAAKEYGDQSPPSLSQLVDDVNTI